jgi:peptide/nickel transport system permease protein
MAKEALSTSKVLPQPKDSERTLLDEPGENVPEEETVQEEIALATPAQLMWWQFRRHRMAMASLAFLLFAYFVAIFAEFFSPYLPLSRSVYLYAPPQGIHFIDSNGNFYLRPFVYGIEQTRDITTLQYLYTKNTEEIYPLRFFVSGESYRLLGLFETDLHLFGVAEGGHIFLLGTDHLGRDMLSRVIYGSRISLSIGLVGVFLSITLGMLLGGLSGLSGGVVDNIIQRIIETLVAIPSIPLWMGLSAAIPPTWSPVRVYFGITVILSLLGWTSVARIARGKFLATREQDFVMAAKLYNSSQWRIIIHHLIPTFISFVIVRITLDIPRIILAETALSFLGIGLRPPVVSWGVLLKEAQKFQVIAIYPWIWIAPAVAVVIVVLAYNFLGDGIRDAADPFSK